jgi:hypothetical protein
VHIVSAGTWIGIDVAMGVVIFTALLAEDGNTRAPTGRSAAEVVLNSSITWNIEARGRASKFLADLRKLRLGSLNLEGGVSRLEVVLAAPSGAVIVVILGGANNVVIRRPKA